MELTREQAIKYHRDMYNNIADGIEEGRHIVNIEESKEIFCRIHGFNVMFNCFLCDYDENLCVDCPVMWGDSVKDKCCRLHNGELGLFHRVRIADSWQEQAELARQIANLPERTDV